MTEAEARAEVERLQKLYAEVVDRLYGQIGRLTADRDEARQIADQLAYAVMNYFSEPPKPAMQAWAARSWRGDVAST